jgi:hypothetical protein
VWSRWRRPWRSNKGHGSGHGGGQNHDHNNSTFGGARQKGPIAKVVCQIYKEGHEANRCCYKYDHDEEDEQHQYKMAGAATTSFGHDTNWYVDSGASDHVTRELEKLTVHDNTLAVIKSTLPMAQV